MRSVPQGEGGDGPRPRPAAALLVFLAVAFPRAARATYEDRFGYSSRAMALGGAFVTLADDPTAAYHNPAALGYTQRTTLTAGFLYGAPLLEAVDKQTGEVTRAEIDDQFQFILGGVLDLSPDFGDLHLGLMAALPALYLGNVPILRTATDPQFLTFSRTQEPIFETAVAYRVLPWLSVGVGLNTFLGVDFDVGLEGDIIVGSGDGALVDISVPAQVTGGEAHIPYVIGATAGLLVAPMDDLRIGIAFRDKIEVPAQAAVALLVPFPGPDPILEVPLVLNGNALIRPRQVSAGVSYRVHGAWTVAFEVTWFEWSGISRTQLSVLERERSAGSITDDLDLIHVSIGSLAPEPAAKDTFVPRLGIEWQALESLSLRAGYYFDEAGFSNKTSGTNFIEPDRHVVSAGTGFQLRDPLRLGDPEKRLSTDLFFQYQIFSGGGSARFRAEGHVVSTGLTLSYRF